jgi:hypothetical protein
VNALRHQLLAGAALADDEHGGIAGRALGRQLAHAARGGAVAAEGLEPVARGRAALALVGAQVAVGALDHGRVAAHEQRARDFAGFHDGRAPHHQRSRADLQHLFGRRFAQAQRGAEVEHGFHVAEHAAGQRGRGAAQQLGHGGVQRLDALAQVDGDHAVLQLAQHGVEPLVACALGAAQSGEVNGVVERLAHGVVGIHEHAGDAGFFGEVGNQAGRDHGLHAGGQQRLHAGGRVVGAAVAELGDAHAEQGVELREVFRRAVERHQPHARRNGAGGGQRAHQVEAAHLDHGHRNVEVLAQPFAAGAGRHHCVDRRARMQRAHGVDRVAEGMRDPLDLRLRRHFGRQPRQHAAQPVTGHGHDAQRAGCGGRLGG